jgi:hypothetical protein
MDRIDRINRIETLVEVSPSSSFSFSFSAFALCGVARHCMAGNQKMLNRSDGREAFGVRRLAGAVEWPGAYDSGSKLPRSRRFAAEAASPIFIVSGAAGSMER